jgi:hypothetical protein
MIAAAVLSLALAAEPDRIYMDGFELMSSCEAAIETPVGPRERLLHAAVSYGVYQAQRPNVDLTEWRNIWGHNSTTDLGTPWPGVGGAAPVIRLFPRWGYIAAHFRTPDDVAGMSGHLDNPSYVAGPNVIMAISAKCGDFTQYLPTPGCRADAGIGDPPWSGVPTADKPLVPWKFSPNAPGSQCNLQPGRDYYVNLMFADPADPINCRAAFPNCVLGTVSYHN